jgi:predicted GNAT family acetyltransferase
MPPHLVEAGFGSVADFWPPWCVVVAKDVICAIAFAARLGPQSAAVGIYTFPDFRGRGLAATVTARWTTLPELAERSLFYGTSETNIASQSVAARLGLERIGLGLRIT